MSEVKDKSSVSANKDASTDAISDYKDILSLQDESLKRS